jgi:ATP-dependent DNA helicase RecQ
MQGVGAAKLEHYGGAFLEVIRAYCGERGIGERPKVARPIEPRRAVASRGSSRGDEVLDLYCHGHGVHEIAERFNVKSQTVTNLLWEAVRAGKSIPAKPLLDASTLPSAEQTRVLAAFRELGVERLRPVYEALGEDVTYEELHLLRVYIVASAE